MKRCTHCKKEKPKSEFHKRAASSDGLQVMCKPCAIIKNKENYSTEVHRRHHFKKLYGMTLDDYDQMFTQQNGRCAICETQDPGGRWGTFLYRP